MDGRRIRKTEGVRKGNAEIVPEKHNRITCVHFEIRKLLLLLKTCIYIGCYNILIYVRNLQIQPANTSSSSFSSCSPRISYSSSSTSIEFSDVPTSPLSCASKFFSKISILMMIAYYFM